MSKNTGPRYQSRLNILGCFALLHAVRPGETAKPSKASLKAALWALHRSDSFREGALRAVNLGNDADTTGAIYGQLAGAYYGVDGIPQSWIERLALRELIDEMASALFDFSNG